MNAHESVVHELSPIECRLRLASQSLGRVVTRVRELVDIFPVNYVLDGDEIVFRTAAGTKLAEVVIGGYVLFEVDHHDEHEAWSVIVRGSARVLETEAEILAAEALPLQPLVPTDKRTFVRISATQVSGRAFEIGEEPRRDGPQDY